MMKDIQFHFENKNFVVVGASSGMGRKISLDLAESGAHVLAVARNEERLRKVQERFPNRIAIQVLDVLKAGQGDWEKPLEDFVAQYGKIHGGVYTAGINSMTPLRGHDEEAAKAIVETSFWGLTRFMQVASRKKFVEKGSSYVAFSSTAAYFGNKGQFAYSAAKGAVQVAVKSWAKEICRDKHRINSVSPAWVESDMTKESMGELGSIRPADYFSSYHLGLGKPEDVSGVVLFLLSDAACWITGTDIVVDGGSSLGSN